MYRRRFPLRTHALKRFSAPPSRSQTPSWSPRGGVCHGRRFTFLFSFISRSSIHHDYRLGRWIQKDEWHSHHDTISRDYSTKLHLDAFFFIYLIVAALSSVSWFAVSNWNSLCWMITWSKLTLFDAVCDSFRAQRVWSVVFLFLFLFSCIDS